MIPLKDNIPSRTWPIVNYGMIAACTLVFLVQVSQPRGGASLIERFGMVPARLLNPGEQIVVEELRPIQTPYGVVGKPVRRAVAPAAVPAGLTVLTCVFLHGGWLHFLGNMWFLYIFGDNVEDRMGHLGYLIFYLGAGVAASVAHLVTNADSAVPTIGASGAIAGVMGAYLFLYPKAMVPAVIPIFIILEMVVLPAPIFLGVWFFMQLFQGVLISTGAEGVAWWAHIGGFLAGLGVAAILNTLHWLRPKVETTRPGADHLGAYRAYPRRRPFP